MAHPNVAGAHGVAASLNANFKEVYTELKDLVPSNTKLAQIPFAKGDKQLGAGINEPVILGLEGGFTYGGTDGDAFTLNNFVSFPLKNATVKSSEMVLRSAISQGAASRSVTQKNSFERGIRLLTGNMQKSMYHRLEISLLYGQSGIGTIKSISGAGPYVVEIDDHEWAAGIWVGLAKARLDIKDEVSLADIAGAQDIEVISYNLQDKSITVDAVGAAAVGNKLFFKGAVESTVHKDMIGLHAISEEQTSLFGIANASEPLFQGNIVDVGTDATTGAAVLSFAKVEEAVARSVEKGLSDEKMTVMVNVNSWNNLLTEQTAKRRYDSSHSTTEIQQGSRSIKFFGQAGEIEICPSTFCKEGFAYAYCEKDLMRVGSSDVTFDPPGYEGEYFKLLENANGFEIRAYSDQALFTSRPGCITQLRYIKS